jgi:hypothetical protein
MAGLEKGYLRYRGSAREHASSDSQALKPSFPLRVQELHLRVGVGVGLGMVR